jgi:Txe/YoeB family toxin of Txe-Axe toxin-antitoxin module
MVITSETLTNFVQEQYSHPLEITEYPIKSSTWHFGTAHPVVQSFILSKLNKSEGETLISHVIGNVYYFRYHLLDDWSDDELNPAIISVTYDIVGKPYLHFIKSPRFKSSFINSYLLRKYAGNPLFQDKLHASNSNMQFLPYFGIYGYIPDIAHFRTYLLAAAKNGELEQTKLCYVKSTKLIDLKELTNTAFEASIESNNDTLIKWLFEMNMKKININFIKTILNRLYKKWSTTDKHINKQIKTKLQLIHDLIEISTPFDELTSLEDLQKVYNHHYSRFQKLPSFSDV